MSPFTTVDLIKRGGLILQLSSPIGAN